jgi:hypothetical protein
MTHAFAIGAADEDVFLTLTKTEVSDLRPVGRDVAGNPNVVRNIEDKRHTRMVRGRIERNRDRINRNGPRPKCQSASVFREPWKRGRGLNAGCHW